MDKQFKVFNSEIKGIDEDEGTLTALISTGAKDRMGESLDPMGLNKKNFDKNPVVLFGHQYDQPPIGKALWVKKSAEGVTAKVKFAPTKFAQEIFELFKGGFMKAFSVGFIPNMEKITEGDGKKQPRTTFLDWELLEFSAVPVPANPEAIALAVKQGVLKDTNLKSMMERSIEEYIAISIKDAALFEKVKEITISAKEGIKLVLGVLKEDDGKTHIQSVLFDKGKWTVAQAEKTKKMFEGSLKDAHLDITLADFEIQPEKKKIQRETDVTEELLAEIKILQDKTDAQERELLNLEYQLILTQKPAVETLSEMTVSDVKNIIKDIANGVIRKAQGNIT